MELCRWLRWKGYYGRSWTSVEALHAEMQANHVQYSCLRTCQAWGPDDDVAALGDCTGDRSCFEASEKGPARLV